MDAAKSVLRFKVNGQLFSVELASVRKVILFTELKSVPGLPKFFMGLLNVHGHNVPVIDLGERLGMQRSADYSIDTPIILVQDGDHQMGLIVDEVTGIDYAKIAKLEVNQSKQNKISELHAGVVHTQEGDALLLKIESLFEESVTL